ncbi:hypothetical protein DAPPUDRAFT_242884 [Daphnia pulex]|uniref:Uncharacterized protein n=1 Tax=Daphnia pulex TaxID=6669 RepID=E9GHK2_DAPPU|nr:hypothetical protein DAPPUDRAFT_242884 [Daphnia pulex]|eukprot:EFX81043.1 hypothetical protein DAPPUDRAFT_242884 [Daphnia pulex]
MKTGPMSMAIKMRRTTPDDIEGNNIFTSMKTTPARGRSRPHPSALRKPNTTTA